MKKRVATLILNRNLPLVCNKLVESLEKWNKDITDIFVIEAGSDIENLSKYTTWHANWDEAKKYGLRFNRGMNYGLSKLIEEDIFEKYEYFFLLTNDTVFEELPIIKTLCSIMDLHNKLGILSPCSKDWGEIKLLQKSKTLYFWFIHTST